MFKLSFNKSAKQKRIQIKEKIEKLVSIFSVIAFFVAVYDFGFLKGNYDFLQNFYYVFLLIYFVSFSTRIPSLFLRRGKLYLIVLKVLLFLFLIFYFFNVEFLFDAVNYHGAFYSMVTSENLVYVLISMIFLIEVSKNIYKIFRMNITPEILFVLSFFVVIMVGSGLLMLPNCTYQPIPFIDALFTATSATCVTGLQVQDAALTYTPLGLWIIAVMIQIGGLGVMTFTCFIVYFFKDTNSFKAGMMVSDLVNSDRMGDAFKTVIKIVIFTFAIEAVGAIMIFYNTAGNPLFVDVYDRLSFSIFNSISSFCNAGFSTKAGSMSDPNLFYDYPFKIIISFLAIAGGIGFPILTNVWSMLSTQAKIIYCYLFKQRRFVHYPRLININTKLASLVSFCLLVSGITFFMIFEYNNSLVVHQGFFAKLVDSFYYSVMPRTVGFNDADMSTFRVPTLLIIMLLMWIGSSPVSTGGGIKTTTFGVAVLDIFSILRGKDRLEIYRRKIANSTVRHAFAVIMISITALFTGTIILSAIEDGNTDVNLLSMSFECISAYSTVGLSIGATPYLSTAGKFVIISLMFLGRVGALTIATAFFSKAKTLSYMYPKEKIYIG